MCQTLVSPKYLHLYMTKSSDKAYVSLTAKNLNSGNKTYDWDEISHYKEFRNKGSSEACLLIAGEPMCRQSHSVVLLPIHEEGEQPVMCHEDCAEEYDRALALGQDTMLTEFFKLNLADKEAGKVGLEVQNLTYKDVV